MTILRRSWLMVPVVLLGSLFLPGLIVWAVDLVAPHYGLEPAIPFDWLDGAANGVGALVWVGLGAGLAPKRRRVLSVGLFLVGAWIANFVLGWWYFPENHAHAYQPSVVPLRLTLACGVGGVLLVWWREWRVPASTPDLSASAPMKASASGEAA